MYYNLIKNNIYKLNKDLTKNFLYNKGIIINDDEAILITNLIKENWQNLYHKNTSYVFSILKERLSPIKYDKLTKLYYDAINQYL